MKYMTYENLKGIFESYHKTDILCHDRLIGNHVFYDWGGIIDL